ncbi:MAG: hypothetical protein ABI835_13290, partial [Chloroflexota bacterium]
MTGLNAVISKSYPFILILTLCAACSIFTSQYRRVSQITQVTSEPEVSFVLNVTSGISDTGSDTLCVEINQAALWEVGNYADELNSHLSQNTEITVDGQIIPNKNLSIWTILTLDLSLDSEGNPTGSFGGPMEICFNVESLGMGGHTGIIRTTSMSGIEKSYTWQFR